MENSKLWESFVSAQKDMCNPVFDSVNPHFRNKYASLASVRNSIVPVLNKHGIAVIQELCKTDSGLSCTTILIHSSGEKYSCSPFEINTSKMDAQGLGAASTYARRYQLQAVCGVVGDEDDDGNEISNSNKNNPVKQNNYSNKKESKKYDTKEVTIKEKEPQKITSLSEEERSIIVDKTTAYCDRLTECKTLDDLKSVFTIAHKEFLKYSETEDGKSSLQTIENVKDCKKIELTLDYKEENK